MPDDPQFLVRDATDGELLTACAENHVDWMRRVAIAAGGTVSRRRDLDWIHTPHPIGEVIVAVTRPPGEETRQDLDELLTFCRDNGVERMSWWAFSDAFAPVLGPWLGARGFRWGGRPHWICADLTDEPAPPKVVPLPDGVTISPTERFTDEPPCELPCFQPGTAAVAEAMAAERPRRIWHLVMRVDGEPVGQMSFNFTSGPLGVGGLNDLFVVPTARVRGLGLVRYEWLRRFALDLGCRYFVANAADDAASLYRMLGFRSLGFGQTWWLSEQGLAQRPSPTQVAFAEAVGRGDLPALEAMVADLSTDDLNAPLSNGLTPMQFAAVNRRPDAAGWLMTRGAAADLLAAWDLGWKDEARRLLRDHSDLVTARRPRSGKTLLHMAVERNDAELAELLLAAGADPTARDHRFDSTPMGWATELRRPRLAAVIRRYAPVNG
jgi:GNAT superfamily N-acetyltransferase